MASQTQPARRRVTVERTFEATTEEIWELWTTADGIEAWWGPEGFETTVSSLDLREGGRLVYVMTAVAPDQVDFMRKAGLPVATEARVTFTELDRPRRLAFANLVDFVPGVEPYSVTTVVEFTPTEGGVKMALTLEAMHDHDWTERSLLGWESQLGRLIEVLSAR